MNEESDIQLLRAYAKHRDENAFRQLILRHTDFVYSAALRQVNSAAMAADLAQQVFTDLATKSPEVASKNNGSSLAGWLHRATRYAILNHLRDDRRRRDHERQAMEQLITNSDPAADWEQIRPVLDEALDLLTDDDREALLLRYFKNQDLRTVGTALGVSDDAAQKRVSRALEKLRDFFSKRKITVGAGSLGILLSANAVQFAPVGLSAKILVATSGITATAGMTMIHKILIAGFAAAAIGSGIFSFHLQKQIGAMQQRHAALSQQITQLSQERDDAKNQLAAAQQAYERRQTNQDELLRLRGEIGVLRRQLDEATEKNRALPAAVLAMSTNSPPQIHLKARFFTMPKDVFAGMGGAVTASGILTDPNFRVALHALEQHSDVEFLAEPEVTTTSGREIQMRATQANSVVTN